MSAIMIIPATRLNRAFPDDDPADWMPKAVRAMVEREVNAAWSEFTAMYQGDVSDPDLPETFRKYLTR